MSDAMSRSRCSRSPELGIAAGGRVLCRFPRRGMLALAGLMLTAWACTPARQPATPPAPPSIEDATQLIEVLRGAGVSVQPTAALADPAFRGSGQVLQIGGQLVQVYEYDSTGERQKISDVILAGNWPSLAERQPPPRGTAVWTAGKLIIAYTGSDGGTHLLLQALLGDPITLAPEVVDEPYPAAVPAVLAAAGELLGVAPSTLEVIGLEERIWPDPCLGLPEPGESCAEETLPGWRVEVRGDGVQAIFRSDLPGEIVRLERTLHEP